MEQDLPPTPNEMAMFAREIARDTLMLDNAAAWKVIDEGAKVP